jgi:hypothetical protein
MIQVYFRRKCYSWQPLDSLIKEDPFGRLLLLLLFVDRRSSLRRVRVNGRRTILTRKNIYDVIVVMSLCFKRGKASRFD